MCEFGYGDLEIAKVWRETARRAAKPHCCSSCGAAIERGEYHLEHVSILDSVSRERMCFPCWWAREDFHQEHAGSPSIMPSMLAEYLRECARDGYASDARWSAYLDAMTVRGAARAVDESRRSALAGGAR